MKQMFCLLYLVVVLTMTPAPMPSVRIDARDLLDRCDVVAPERMPRITDLYYDQFDCRKDGQ